MGGWTNWIHQGEDLRGGKARRSKEGKGTCSGFTKAENLAIYSKIYL